MTTILQQATLPELLTLLVVVGVLLGLAALPPGMPLVCERFIVVYP